MNKNLKKVISAVAALSLSASSIAAFAAGFPDVESTASYAQAVQELSALNIISGYDDGTFGPDKLVTRAEISKMIVDALAETREAEASSVSSKFSDVNNAGENGHWATGYINQGVADGWISGYSDTEFGPDDNVTYVQAQKMLVSATGYDIYATQKGGWPAGYKMYGASLEITKGVQDIASDDQQLTRAQVAQMIDNAMDAPLCLIDDWKIEWNGSKTPVLDVKDGEGKDYQTLFTKKHDAYKVYGRVTDTSKTGSNIDTDKVMFRVEKADNFDDEYIKASDERDADEMYIGDTNAENMLRTYAQALVQKNDDDEYTLLSIVPAAVNKSIDLLADDIDDAKSDLETDGNKVLYFFPSGQSRGSVKYQIADDVEYYVNGVHMGAFDTTALEDYIINNDTAMVTLQKETAIGSTNTSSKYNVVMITTFATAVVEQVIDKTDEVVINFKEQSTGIKTKMTLEKDDDSYKYTFTMNDEDVDPTELEEFDVLSISYDVGDGSSDAFADSKFYDVKVSRDTAEGKYTGKNSAGDEFTIGDTKYKLANGISCSFDNSTEYTIYLDAFGRIAYSDEKANSKKFGILKNVYQKNNGDYVAEVITKEGTIEEFTLDDENGADYMALVKSTAQKDVKTAYPEQVIEYKTTSSGKLTIKSVDENDKVTTETYKDAVDGEYKKNSSKIGSLKISDATTIIDISNADKKKDDIKVISKDNLKDGSEYTAYGFDKSNNDSVYRFVIITDGMNGLNSASQLAVFIESGSTTNEDGDDVDTMTVMYNGEKVTIDVDDDAEPAIDVTDYEEGDAIIYSTNSSGEIDEVLPVFAAKGLLNNFEDFDDCRDSILADPEILAATNWNDELSDGDQDNVNVIFGAVVKNGNGYTVAPIIENDDPTQAYVNLNSADNIDLTMGENTKIYTYNFKHNKKNAGRLSLDDGMSVTPDVTSAYEDGDKSSDNYYIGSEDVAEDVVFAVVRTFDDDEAQEIYLIVNN